MRDYTQLSQKLLNNADFYLQDWLSDGKRSGNEYKSINPTRADNKIGSFSINRDTGMWSDFADANAKGGNLISLYAYLFGKTNSEAYDELSSETQSDTYTQNYNPLKTKKYNKDDWVLLPLPIEVPSGIHFELGIPMETYRYKNFYIFRYIKPDGSKDIRPMTYRENIHTGKREWRWKGVEYDRPIYNLDSIGANRILIVEGEKAANVKVDGFTVVSWAGGSNAISKTNWSILREREDVFYWADRDEAGLKTIAEFKEILPLLNIVSVDFSINDGQDIADITKDEIQNKLRFFTQPSVIEVKTVIPKPKEIVIEYDTQYPPIRDITSGVIIARTGSGKTYRYENRPNYLILVPRTEQATLESGVETDYFINKILTDGAIVTYNKFYGHYKTDGEFKDLVDRKRIIVVVDEAHMLLSLPTRMYRTIYYLDAVFMSGTLEKFFREDLQRYKYKPTTPTTIYYTDAKVPVIDGSLIFVDNKKALVQNYHNQFIVSKQHELDNVDVHKTDLKQVYATSCLREGISVKNDNFNACIVYAQGCNLWSTKDIIQGVHRIRKDCLRLVTKEPNPQYVKYLKLDWWLKKAEEYTSVETAHNAVMGEFYSELIKSSCKTNKYIKADEYGVACYLAKLTKDNYDTDFYVFEPYNGLEQVLNIDLDTIDEKEDEERLTHTTKDGNIWTFDKKDKKRFYKWAEIYESGLLFRILKLNEFKNLNYIYRNSSIVKEIKKNYNKQNKNRGEKYSIDIFYKLFLDLVQFEMVRDDNGEKIERVGSTISLKNVSIKITGICGIKSVVKVTDF